MTSRAGKYYSIEHSNILHPPLPPAWVFINYPLMNLYALIFPGHAQRHNRDPRKLDDRHIYYMV